MRPSPRLTLALLAATAPALRAQAPSALPVGAARVGTDAGVTLDPGRSWSVSAAFVPFVTSRWQVGVEPDYFGVRQPGGGATFQRLSVAALANYLVPLGRGVHGYVGGYAGRAGATGAGLPSSTTYGGQAGLLRFVAPAAALRAEASWRRFEAGGDRGAATSLLLTLDPYAGGAAQGARWTRPTLGAVDVDLLASATFSRGDFHRIRFGAAPFITPWAQLGARYELAGGDGPDQRAFDAFARAYVPLAGRTAPFAEALGLRQTFGGGRPAYTYGGAVGVRRYLNPNVAADLALQRTTLRAGGRDIADQTGVRLGLVTQLRRRASP